MISHAAVVSTFLLVSPLAAQWQQTSGPTGGIVSAIAGTPSRLYAATYAGVFISTDGGSNWTASNNGLQMRYLSSVAVLGKRVAVGGYQGFEISFNEGRTWIQRGRFGGSYVTSVIMRDSLILAATNRSGVQRTTDFGINWMASGSGLRESWVEALLDLGDTILAGTKGAGVFRSTDDGITWTEANNGMRNFGIYSFTVSGRSVFAGTGFGVYRSDDRGLSWGRITPESQSYTIYSFDIFNGKFVAGSYNGAFVSTNGGITWSYDNLLFGNKWILSLRSFGLLGLAGSGNGGVFRSTNGGFSWQQSNTGMPNTYVRMLALHNGVLFAASSVGVHLSTNQGDRWRTVNAGLQNSDVLCIQSTAAGVYAGTDNFGGVYHFDSANQTWQRLGSTSPSQMVRDITWYSGKLFAATPNGVFRLDQQNWTEVNNGIHASHRAMVRLCVYGRYLFAANASSVYRSSDAGQTWTLMQGSWGVSGFSLMAHNSELLSASFTGVWSSADSGLHWRQISPSHQTFSLATSGQMVFAGSFGQSGVFFRPHQDSTWRAASLGLWPDYCYALVADSTYLYVSPYQQGVWRRPLAQFRDITVDTLAPTSFQLYQNYPNPFNSSTTIRVDINTHSRLTLRLFDLQGKQVRTLADQDLGRGAYQFYWDGTNEIGIHVASGIYFYRVTAGAFTSTRRMLLLK